ncbi:DNA repair protein RecO [Limimaricola variabilis]
MISWREEGALLRVRRHGEGSAIIEVLTRGHGLHAGVVRGGGSRRIAPLLQPGAQLDLTWTARLGEHLGNFTFEPVRSRADRVMADRLALAGLNAVAALLVSVLPERDPHPPLYDRTVALLDLLGETEVWPLAYLRWELSLLEEMGFALDLSRCAVTGATEGLDLVSPKSGRAVSRAGAGTWASKLLPLPPVLRGEGDAAAADVIAALATTGWFIEHRLLPGSGDRPLPPARARLIEAIERTG